MSLQFFHDSASPAAVVGCKRQLIFLPFPAEIGAEHGLAAQVLHLPYKVSVGILLSVGKAI